MSDAIHTYSDDASLLKRLIALVQPPSASATAYLRDNGVSDSAVISAYRIGSAPVDFEVGGKKVDGAGVLIPTFDPSLADKPVGYVRCWAARNNHKFVTAPAA